MDSLALKIYSNKLSHDRNEVGKLFGAFSVISALSAGTISSALYGFVYSSTVAVFPQAFLIVSMCMSFLVLFFLSLVHVPSDPIETRASPIEHENEEGSQRMVTPEILVVIGDEVAEEQLE
ncbi:hypothetical protein JVU11DRAFT_3620 [Chiua virens]|nr:hypothetical protein JVU11DRAFT_3620 [Chiua virens]